MKPAWTILTAITLLLTGVGVAGAQEPAADRVQASLELTDRRIGQAESLLGPALGPADAGRARSELGLAVSLQAEARRVFTNAQYGLAGRLTLEARGHADRAIAILNGPDPDGVLAQLDRTRDLVERARDRIDECDVPRARGLLRIALQMQDRAESLAHEGRFLAALQLSGSARERAHRALRLCRLEEDLGDAASRALERTEDLLARIRERLAQVPDPRAQAALDQAIDAQGRARAEASAGRFEASLRMTQQARTFAHRSARLAGLRL